ncbi:TRAP transporter substrate-binding protein DctP [Pelagibius sp. Alg239-R121]|uniref:TRAP transporter substrate-binding protein DctP n=1 Tax=Pelagibius sp. Alg239-R121 TaxID=2993448 RepID=UPI0024A6FA0C|nr:TRAP transporter substrate-binding protein DctP [Pelagibius sp. Alg239-R121]
MKSTRTGMVLFAALGMAFSAGTSTAAENWSMATSWGGGPPLETAAKGFAEMAAFLTNDEIKIEVFPGGTLGSPLKVTETVRNGVAEIGHHWVGYDWGIDKTTVLFGGWTGGLNAEEMIHWIYEGGGLSMWQEYKRDKFGVVSFPCGIYPREVGLHSTKKVQTIADFKGLKQRTAGAWAEISAELGVSTVILPGAEVYPALERGVIDAVEWSTPYLNKSAGFYKIAKYIVLPGYHHPTSVLECNVNAEVWDRIGERNQQLLLLAGKLTTHKVYEETGHEDASAYKFYEESGNEIVVVNDEVISKTQELAQAWADKTSGELGGWFTKILENQRAYKALWANAHKYRDTKAPAK